MKLPFDGYQWWYLDAASHDGSEALTIIGFLGSVFSPYYAFARRRGPADPENYCSINVALYGKSSRWCMTERGRNAVSRSSTRFSVGPSSMEWQDGTLVIKVNEIGAPIPRSTMGEVRFIPATTTNHIEQLDREAFHFWRPVAPDGEVSVVFNAPKLSWKGRAYLDMNWGYVPLEKSFRSWTWSRTSDQKNSSILYDIVSLDGGTKSFGLQIDGNKVEHVDVPPSIDLGKAFWRMNRTARSEGPGFIKRALEDAPFYTRSIISSRLFGEERVSFHESLSLERFKMPVVQAMLPFRMPRWIN